MTFTVCSFKDVDGRDEPGHGVWRSVSEAPAKGLAGAEGNDGGLALADALRYPRRLAAQCDPRFVGRQAVECRAVQRREGFETIERRLLLEHFRIGLERARGGED